MTAAEVPMTISRHVDRSHPYRHAQLEPDRVRFAGACLFVGDLQGASILLEQSPRINLRPFAMRAMLSMETFRSARSIALK
jgi:hypothetical protein